MRLPRILWHAWVATLGVVVVNRHALVHGAALAPFSTRTRGRRLQPTKLASSTARNSGLFGRENDNNGYQHFKNGSVPRNATAVMVHDYLDTTTESSFQLQRNKDETNGQFGDNSNNNDAAATGIGGQGGIVYDVNSLKRNLLQETMRAFKAELFDLLSSPLSTEDSILEKLAALVQASPVRTTTDSNLLDGTWSVAYKSRHSTIRDLKEHQPLTPEERKQRNGRVPWTPAMRRMAGKEVMLFRSFRRTVCLEHLEEDEDAHVLDETRYFGGLVTVQTRYQVQSLTRQSLRLTPVAQDRYVLGRWRKNMSKKKTRVSRAHQRIFQAMEMHIAYCDVNLCIIADEDGDTYTVFTKHKAWTEPSRSFPRKLRFAAAALLQSLPRFLPIFRNNKASAPRSSSLEDGRQLLDKDPILREIRSEDSSAVLRVLKLGDSGLEDEEDDAWEGVADPFVHLSADDRQKLLKDMKLGQIERAATRHRLSKRFRNNNKGRKKSSFNRPSDDANR